MDTNMKTIGIIDYINSVPFSYGLKDHFNVVKDTPSGLARRFAAAELDISFVPSIAYLRHFRHISYLVPDVSISSFGPVNSVFLKYRGSIDDIASVKLSGESVTSNFIITLILKERYFLPAVSFDRNHINADAEVIIGDAALKLKLKKDEHLLDIGHEWYEMTSLPLVYAVCIARSADCAEYAGKILSEIREHNMDKIESILSELKHEKHLHYLRRIDYRLDLPHRKTLNILNEKLSRNKTVSSEDNIKV